MPALTEARYEAIRCARAAARAVLAKHPRVTLGGVWGRGIEAVSIDLRPEGDRQRLRHKGGKLGGGQDVAGVGGSK
ncbi:hypothetical protein [Lichenibacterium dinghuense]|uniref:hypothetical protein n=1 Tax=Lichenibacterium dinghuense TaxID=2895977 RepID=UPI001F20AC89|nr:hypothetical protein [Lichenibacterium sp. 6Y81]